MPVNRILFLTTLNLASNPRLVKEIDLACRLGMEIQVLCFGFDGHWSSTMNDQIKKRYSNVSFIEIPAGRKPFFSWLYSVVLEKLARILSRLGMTSDYLAATGSSRRTVLLLQAKQKIHPVDWVVAHNPGAFFPAAVFAKRFSAKLGVDLEDYHPGEGDDLRIQRMILETMKRVLPLSNYISFASAPIKMYTETHIELPKNQQRLTVLNFFDHRTFKMPSAESNSSVLRLVWFSQQISYHRGLEFVIPAVHAMGGLVELHLYGNMDPSFEKQVIGGSPYVKFHGTCSQEKLHSELSCYHVGLALEPQKDLNNGLAVSNKIIAYLQAGLYVLASDTPGQRSIVAQFPDAVRLLSTPLGDLNDSLKNLYESLPKIISGAKDRFGAMQSFNWEVESDKLKFTWTRSCE